MGSRFFLQIVAASALLLVGCAHAPKPAAAPEADYDWSQFKGGSSSSSDSSASKSDDSKSDTKSSASSDTKTDSSASPSAADTSAKSDDDASKAASSVALPHKPSKKKIRGESVSVVGADALAGASKTALKSKVVSSNVIVGPEYEMVQVVLKDASVQIVRPATSPDSSGPKLRSPKVRKDSLSSTESGWYDADADVLVLVQATKSAKSKKALGALLKK